MTTKEYLGQISRLNRMIQNKLQEICQLKVLACNVTISNEIERVQTSPDNDKIGSVVSKIVDKEKEVDKMIEKRASIVKQIESIPDTNCYDVLAKRYILGKDYKVISVENKTSIRQIRRLHDKAVNDFEEMFGEVYLSCHQMS